METKTEVFKRSWELYRNDFGNWSKCLTQAWKVVKLRNEMKLGFSQFKFTKKDGTVRSAVGTLTTKISKGIKPAPLSVVAYYDCEKEKVRSFKINSLI